jgi:hypothetical protein
MVEMHLDPPQESSVKARANAAKEAKEKSKATNDSADIERALDWAIAQSEDGHTCPICGHRHILEGKNQPGKLRDHMGRVHLFRTIAGFERGSLDETPTQLEKVDKIIEATGELVVVDDDDAFDALYVPAVIRERATRDGGGVRWVAPRNVDRNKDVGWEIVKREKGESIPNINNSSEDDTVRTNEMVLMRQPPQLKRRMEAMLSRKNDNQLWSRKEEFDRKLESHARTVYDTAVRHGADATQAGNLARAAERGLSTGSIHIREGNKQ